MTHIACMIDLETLALDSHAAILSIGAVIIDLDDTVYDVIETFYRRCSLKDQKRIISEDTLDFHFSQPAAIIKENFTGEKIPLHQMLLEFITFYEHQKPITVWSKGVDFDIAIMEDAFDQYVRNVPWHYRDRCCFRTIDMIRSRLGINNPSTITLDMKHTALADATLQAHSLHYTWQQLKKIRE